jgi:hypothetical protein
MPETLRDLRKQRQITLEDAVARLREIEPTAPTTHVGLIHIENRGTDRLPIIRGLARVYGLPFEVVASAAENPAQKKCTEMVSSA